MTDPFATLDGEQRRRAKELAEKFRALGADDPEEWASSEVAEDIPQLARFLLLRKFWSGAERWTEDPQAWFGPAGDEPAPDHPEYPHEPAAQAIRRALEAGLDRKDLMRIARAIVFESFFDVVHAIDEGFDPDAGDDLPGWVLAEVAPDGMGTGRAVAGLHESLLTTAPPLFADEADGGEG